MKSAGQQHQGGPCKEFLQSSAGSPSSSHNFPRGLSASLPPFSPIPTIKLLSHNGNPVSLSSATELAGNALTFVFPSYLILLSRQGKVVRFVAHPTL